MNDKIYKRLFEAKWLNYFIVVSLFIFCVSNLIANSFVVDDYLVVASFVKRNEVNLNLSLGITNIVSSSICIIILAVIFVTMMIVKNKELKQFLVKVLAFSAAVIVCLLEILKVLFEYTFSNPNMTVTIINLISLVILLVAFMLLLLTTCLRRRCEIYFRNKLQQEGCFEQEGKTQQSLSGNAEDKTLQTKDVAKESAKKQTSSDTKEHTTNNKKTAKKTVATNLQD